MSTQLSKLLMVVLRCDRSAPWRARQAVRALQEIDQVRDDALLVTSELVSNAVLHSGCDPEEQIEVMAARTPIGVRIEVVDVGRSGKHAELCDPDARAYGGMGLRLVDALSERWGADREDRLRVWAELAA
jgi:anti-sigma regulatory factor (Ser/Thr protein kinase)